MAKKSWTKWAHAKLMNRAFHELSLAKYSTEHVFNKAKSMGLACNKNRFLTVVRNPVYCGNILITKFKDEPPKIFKGLHKPIITEAMFYEVQDILEGKKER